MSAGRDELVKIIWDGAVADRVKDGKDPKNAPVVRCKVEAVADKIIAAGWSNAVEAALDETVWNYIQADDPLLTCPVCHATVAWSDKDDHLEWHRITQQGTKAQAIDKAADDADGLGMEEVPVHSLRFRAECYRNMGANLYGDRS